MSCYWLFLALVSFDVFCLLFDWLILLVIFAQIMALFLRVPANTFQRDNVALLSGGRRQNSTALFSGGRRRSSAVFGRRRSAIRILSMSTPPIQHLEKPSAGSQNLGLPIMVTRNWCIMSFISNWMQYFTLSWLIKKYTFFPLPIEGSFPNLQKMIKKNS